MQGYEAAQEAELRRQAAWVALLLSAQSGQTITPAQLLGEEPLEQDMLQAAEARLAALKKKQAEAAHGG